MECNRDEAIRAKEIAEKKFTANDVSGAKKFALKAQTLYPDLKGLSQMLATLDVHLSAEKKIDGESDWYGILGVDPSADHETLKNKYKKLALLLHPDKNKSVGADEAFKLISEAWSLLSHNSKRIAYDTKRFPKTSQHHNHVPPPPPPAAAAAASGMGDSSTPPPPPHRSSLIYNVSNTSFWTVCGSCKMHYECLWESHVLNLQCPSCHQSFWLGWFSQQQQNSNHHSATQNAAAHASAINTHAATNWGSSAAAFTAGDNLSRQFLTDCSRCKMPYVYSRVNLNRRMLCSNCHEYFVAVETVGPTSNGSSTSSTPPWWWFSQQQQQQQQQHQNLNNYPSSQHAVHPSAWTTNTMAAWGSSWSSSSSSSSSAAAAAFTTTGGGYNWSGLFFTNCSHCKMPYVHSLVHLNQFLPCSNCHQLFLAVSN